MSELVEVVDLERMLDRVDEPRRCTSASEHKCTKIARWLCATDSTACSSGGHRVDLWCDGRYAEHLDDLAAGNVVCLCTRPLTHWTVRPL